MMSAANPATWLRRIRINQAVREEILRKLFQMNVHELALFPDLDALARFLRQKAQIFGARSNEATAK